VGCIVKSFPFLTSYDPPGTSEGALDPLGLYQIADHLAVQLVPAVRERMQRIRFLTAIAVGALVTEGLEDDSRQQDASPYLVWEWLVVEALIRRMGDNPSVWGVPGTQVAGRALDQQGYLDARSYLKTPRIFGFHGVYKRLASHVGLIDVNLSAGPGADALADIWARGIGFRSLSEARPALSRWTDAVRRCLREKPPRSKPGWNGDEWEEVARAFAPVEAKGRERRALRELLLSDGQRRLGALPALWQLVEQAGDKVVNEELLHTQLGKSEPRYKPLLDAIRSYESFARSLQDAFDVLKSEATSLDSQGFVVTRISGDDDFKQSVKGLHAKFAAAHRALGEIAIVSMSLQNLFSARFASFSEPRDSGSCALALCEHHEMIQQKKSADGKRPWFDRVDSNRIYIRHAYREPRRDIAPGRYLHDYRGVPIRRFYRDLS
jgi:hypothetical protein